MRQNENEFLREGFKVQPKVVKLVDEFKNKIEKKITDFLKKCWESVFEDEEDFPDDFTGGWNDGHPSKKDIEYFMRRQKNFNSSGEQPWRLNWGFIWMSNLYEDIHNDFEDSDDEWPKIYIYYKVKGTQDNYDISNPKEQDTGSRNVLLREDPFGNSGGLFCTVLKSEDLKDLEEKFELLYKDFRDRFSKEDLPQFS